MSESNSRVEAIMANEDLSRVAIDSSGKIPVAPQISNKNIQMKGGGYIDSSYVDRILDQQEFVSKRGNPVLKNSDLTSYVDRVGFSPNGDMVDLLGQYGDNYNPKDVLPRLGACISKKLDKSMGFELGTATIDDYNTVHGDTIVNRNLLANLTFEGYDTGTKNLKSHAWFYMGLINGESKVLNPPFQGHALDDVRSHTRYTKIGRLYVENIYTRMPIIMVEPGYIKYNTGFLKMLGFDGGGGAARVALIRTGGTGLGGLLASAWSSVTDMAGVVGNGISAIFGGSRMVEWVNRRSLYRLYADGLLSSTAINMGLTDWTSKYMGGDNDDRVGLDYIQPGYKQEKAIGSITQAYSRNNRHLAWMGANNISISESFSNSTTTNPVQEQMNSVSQQRSNEDKGGAVGAGMNMINNLGAVFSGGAGAANAGFKIISRVGTDVAGNGSETALVMSGATRSSMPEVWESSSYSRSFSFSFKFGPVPYGDPLSLFENNITQTLLWIPFCMPRQIGAMSYMEPFNIRVYVPGMFTVNYGIVESLTIKRGEDINDWTVDNLPRTISLDISVKDYEPNILLPLCSRNGIKAFAESLFPTSAISEYICMMSGLSFTETHSFRERLGRSVKHFTNAWRRVFDKENITSAIFGNNTVNRIGSIFAMFTPDTLQAGVGDAMLKGDYEMFGGGDEIGGRLSAIPVPKTNSGTDKYPGLAGLDIERINYAGAELSDEMKTGGGGGIKAATPTLIPYATPTPTFNKDTGQWIDSANNFTKIFPPDFTGENDTISEIETGNNEETTENDA